jgi:spermidine synthase
MTSEPARPSEQTKETKALSEQLVLNLVLACFILSGFSALLYQVIWLKQFTLVFGAAHIATAMVLAAYMSGLALGAALASRLNPDRNPIRLYGTLEALIAASALFLPLGLHLGRSLYLHFFGALPVPPNANDGMQGSFLFLMAFGLLLVPTSLMGATLPLLTRYVVRDDRHLGPRVGLLYSANTLGAVFGAAATGFLLLPTLGTDITLAIGIGTNVAIFLAAFILSRAAKAENLQPSLVKPRGANRGELRAPWILPTMLISGFVTFSYEVLWTRLLTHLFGGTIYAFTIMLATILTGIALGGWLGGRLARDYDRAIALFAGTQASSALAAGLTYILMSKVTPSADSLLSASIYASAIMIPPALFLGATFPIAVRIRSAAPSAVLRASSQVYSWNTIGAILGSLACGYIFLPTIGFSGSAKLLVATSALLGLCTLWMASKGDNVRKGLATIAASVLVLVFQPGRPDAIIQIGAKNEQDGFVERYFGVGRSASVLLRETKGVFELSTDGLPEASIFRSGTPPVRHSQHWLTALPAIARPDAKSILMIGFGGGVALEATPPGIDRVDVVELEPQVLKANEIIANERRHNPFTDPRVNIVVNDARNALERTSALYDIIISQPSHPWTAGSSNLYTEEFIRIAHDHLTPSGVFLQWIDSQYVNESLLSVLAATVSNQFKYSNLYQPSPGVLLFLASDEPLDLGQSFTRATADEPTRAHYRRLGIASVEDLMAAYFLDTDGIHKLAGNAPNNTDTFNRLAFQSRSRGDGLSPGELDELLAPLDPLIGAELGDGISSSYLIEQLMRIGFSHRADRLIFEQPDATQRSIMTATVLNYLGKREEAKTHLLSLDEKETDASEVGDLLARFAFADISKSKLDKLNTLTLSDDTRVVVNGWQLASAREWEALSRLDTDLAGIPSTHPLAPIALRLRVDWRLAAAQQTGKRGYGADALDILDQSLALYWNTNLYILRAGAGAVSGQDDVIVESAWAAAKSIESRLNDPATATFLSSEERSFLASRLTGLNSAIPSQESGRTEEVKQRLEAIQRELAQR